MIALTPRTFDSAVVAVPGSKSYTHRILIAAALSDGLCRIDNALRSEDTRLTANALRQLGVPIEDDGQIFRVHGKSGSLQPCAEPIWLGNSGTSMRLLTAVAALGRGTCILTGTARMRQRPILDLVAALQQIGVDIRTLNGDGCPPVEVRGGPVAGGSVRINCAKSSQYLSALLLAAPYSVAGLDISVTEGPVSKPYIDMTAAVMERLGVVVRRSGYTRFQVAGGQCYRAGTYRVEPDASQAGYFWAAAAITGASVKVAGISKASRQGDVRFVELLQKMGCRVLEEADGIRVAGGALRGVDVDMADMPDLVPTLAVVAAFAQGTTAIRNVAHLRVKESDRLAAVAAELEKMGIAAQATESGLIVAGGKPQGALIETYNDHRIAMSFALAGLRIPGMKILDESCVEKSFPEFWRVLETLK